MYVYRREMKPVADVVNAISGVINGRRPGTGEERVTGGDSETGVRAGSEMIGSSCWCDKSRGCRELATAFVAAIGDVDLCCYRTYRHFHEFAHVVGYFPVLGFAGDRVGRVRGGEEWGKMAGPFLN